MSYHVTERRDFCIKFVVMNGTALRKTVACQRLDLYYLQYALQWTSFVVVFYYMLHSSSGISEHMTVALIG